MFVTHTPDIQRIVNEWQRSTFPDATEFDYLNKCAKELGGLRDALNGGTDGHPCSTQSCAEEAADVVICIMGLMMKLGMRLEDAIMVKMSVNIHRTWSKDDDGQYHHV